MSERWMQVIEPGAMATVQDLGRPGWAHLGVPRSGAVDLDAHRLANRLVGNLESAASVEITLGGFCAVFGATVTVALTGADCQLRVNDRAHDWGSAVTLRVGERLTVGPAERGLRAYLAVAGGFLTEEVLGSRATDTLGGLGPAAIARGDRLAIGESAGSPAEVVVAPRRVPDSVRVIWGPRDDLFSRSARTRLLTSEYVVLPESNRVAARLDGPPLNRRSDAELPSEGIITGAVQVPPDGRPIIFLADHPTTGGYPVIAVVDPRDLWVVAQARPGDALGFTDR